MDKVINKKTNICPIKNGENEYCKLYSIVEDNHYYNENAKVLILQQGSQDDHFRNGNSIWLMDKFSGNNQIYGHKFDCYNEDFIPIIAKYKVHSKYDSSIDFANGLIDLSQRIKDGNLDSFLADRKIILEGKSQGGLNAILASENSIFEHIFAVSPPILGSPMANLKLVFENIRTPMDFGCYFLNLLITLSQTDYQYRLEQFNGLIKMLEEDSKIIDTKKVTVIGGTIEKASPKTTAESALLSSYKLIKRITKYMNDEVLKDVENDGLVLFNKLLLEQYGFNVVEFPNFYHNVTSGGQQELQQKVFELIKKINYK